MDELDRRLRAIFIEEMTNRTTSEEAKEQIAAWAVSGPVPGSTGDAVMAAMVRAYYAGRASVTTDQVLF
jgi:hypothetical protein